MGEKKDLVSKRWELSSRRVLIDRCLEKETKIILSAGQSLRIILLPHQNHSQKSLEVFLRGDHSRVEILGAVLGRGQDRFNLDVKTIHQGVGTSAYTHVRGVLFDESYVSFSGLIRIDKGANKTSSLLENRVLVLGEKARAESIPSLEIEADDVKASHAATVGKIDPDQLFYLQSRGIELKTAVRMIVDGFFDPILSKIDDEKLVARIKGDLWVDILRESTLAR